MKKYLLGLLLVVAIIMVSCSQDFQAQDKLISIRFSKLEARTIDESVSVSADATWGNATVQIGNVSDYYWTYKATKKDASLKTGQTEGFVSWSEAKGLEGSKKFSSGKWKFELKAYATEEDRKQGTKAVFAGEATTENLTSTTTVSVPMSYTYVSGEGAVNFTVSITLSQPEGSSYEVTKIDMLIADKTVALSKGSTSWTGTQTEIASGKQTVQIKLYVADEESPRISKELGTAFIMHGLTTNVMGSAIITLTETEAIDISFDSTLPTEQPTAEVVGTVGPGGGYIFYDVDADNDKAENDGLTSATLGWRYIQAATSDVSGSWGSSDKLATGTVIGTGYSNTKKIYAATATGSSNMATVVWNQTIDDGTGWFIPSKDELNLMYTNLKLNNLGSLSEGNYWSSSENSESSNHACALKFSDASLLNGGKDNSLNVRPVRYLTASKEVYVPTGFIVGETALNSGYIFYDVDEDNTADGPGADGLMSSECGWRYLQAATNIKAIQNKAWGPSESIATGTEIGTGYANTKKLYEAGSSNETYMATSVWNQTIDGATGWFIPSKAELEVLQLNLKNVITFPSFVYWSSSENTADSTKGYGRNLKTGSEYASAKTYVDTRVCPVRYLTASGEVYIPTT